MTIVYTCILYACLLIRVQSASIEPQSIVHTGVEGSIAVEPRLVASKADNGVSFPAYNESSIQTAGNGSELGGTLIENDSSPSQIYNLHYYDDSNEDTPMYGGSYVDRFADKFEEGIEEVVRKVAEIIRGITGWRYPDVSTPDSSLI